jgi:methylthioribulose-1-phosphate dehydratase
MHRRRGNSRKRSAADPSKKAFESASSTIAEIGREFHIRGWVLGTSGNFSAVLHREPLRLAITSTGSDKGHLSLEQILEVDETLTVFRGQGRPSAETALHLAIVGGWQAGAVLHTHSVWSTVLSGWHAAKGGVAIEGYEMLKGLEGIRTHEHREWLPIVENSQDMRELAQEVSKTLQDNPGAHGFLLRGHGLYTWGAHLPEAKRHVEILEFLMETLVRTAGTAC